MPSPFTKTNFAWDNNYTRNGSKKYVFVLSFHWKLRRLFIYRNQNITQGYYAKSKNNGPIFLSVIDYKLIQIWYEMIDDKKVIYLLKQHSNWMEGEQCSVMAGWWDMRVWGLI